jgi:hypothetical protein
VNARSHKEVTSDAFTKGIPASSAIFSGRRSKVSVRGAVHMVTDEWSYLGVLGKLSLCALLLVVALSCCKPKCNFNENVCGFGLYCQIWLDRAEKIGRTPVVEPCVYGKSSNLHWSLGNFGRLPRSLMSFLSTFSKGFARVRGVARLLHLCNSLCNWKEDGQMDRGRV